MTVLLALATAGCGLSSPSEAPRTESRAADQEKIRDLSKKGYNFREIRSIMNGEEPAPRPKKKSGGPRR
jgi:hypothetical protein